MKVARLMTAVAGAGLAVSVLAGCASSQSDKMMSDAPKRDVVAERQRVMKLHGALWKDIQDKQKAGNIEGIAVSAEALALSAQRIPGLFPKGSLTAKSNVKPEVWEKWSDFEMAAHKLETESVRLRDAAMTKNAQATQDVMKDFGRQACGTCHTPFRVPPKQG
jgi:cytochrome c556